MKELAIDTALRLSFSKWIRQAFSVSIAFIYCYASGGGFKTIIMNLQEFKNKYFTDNFYWVNESNYQRLQEIALEVGCLCHTGKKEVINWHEGFKNLGFRTYDKNNNVTVFQKELFLMHNETATNFDQMLKDYESVATCA